MLFKSITFFLFVCPYVMFSQTDVCAYFIRGKVLDKDTKAPIPYVSIKVKGTEKTTTTNTEGSFFIKGLCSDKNTLIISCFGYCDAICEYHHRHGKMSHIYLTQEVFELGDVTIQAERSKEIGTQTIPQIVLGKEKIRRLPMPSLASVVSQEQGVTLISTGSNIQLPMLHGLYGNRIFILNNGVKHGFQNWGTDHAPEIDIASAHNVAIIKGASGVRFGPEALGGAIVVQPNPLYFNEPFYTEMGMGYQTNGKGIFTTIETGKGFKTWSYFLSGTFTKIGDKHTPNYSLTNSGKEEQSINFGIRYHLNDLDFKIYYDYTTQNLSLLRSSVAESGNAFVRAIEADKPTFIKGFSYDINEPNQLIQHHLGKAEINWTYSDDGKLTFRMGKQLNMRKEYDVRRNADKPIINLDLMTSDYQLEWKHPDWLKLDGLIGIQIFNQDNDNNPNTGTTPLIPNYNMYRYSAFITENRRFRKNMLEVGLRIDYESNSVRGRETDQTVFRDEYHFTSFTASLGYTRTISENSIFKTNFGTAWRTPNMAELYSFGQHGFKTSFGLLRYYTNDAGNLKTNRVIKMNESEILPEKGYKFINEFMTTKKSNTYKFAFYTHYIANYIFDRPLAVIGTIRGPMPAFVFDQVDAIFIGLDFTWEKDWSKQFSGIFGSSYLWSMSIDKNEPLIDQPPISMNYKLIWKHKRFFNLDASALIFNPSYTFQQFRAPRTIPPDDLVSGITVITSDSELFDFKDAPKGYFLFDLSWRFEWKKVMTTITAKNVLNTQYRTYLNKMRYFADEPGRNVFFAINYIF